MRGSLLYIIVAFLIYSCSDQSVNNVVPDPEPQEEAVYILCEGLWGMDNSSLTRYELSSGNLIDDYYSYANQGFKLGDIANDIVITDSLAIIAVSTSMRIEIVNLYTGKIHGRIEFSGIGFPRKIAIVNDSLAYVSRQNGNMLSLINYRLPAIIYESIPVGASPEGIAYNNGLIYVANSGFGDYNQGAPKASTVSVIDITSNIELSNIRTGLNPMEVLVSPIRSRLYVSYNNLPSLVSKYDSSGGIIEYKLPDMTEARHWKCNPRSLQLNSNEDTLYFINGNQRIGQIDLKDNQSGIQYLITIRNKYDNWYSLALSPIDRTLWIGNARNYQSRGLIEVYSSNDSMRMTKSFQCGVNPNKIILK